MTTRESLAVVYFGCLFISLVAEVVVASSSMIMMATIITTLPYVVCLRVEIVMTMMCRVCLSCLALALGSFRALL